MYSLKGNCAASVPTPNFHILESLCGLYIPTFGLPILLQKNMLTDPICFEYSVSCLCGVVNSVPTKLQGLYLFLSALAIGSCYEDWLLLPWRRGPHSGLLPHPTPGSCSPPGVAQKFTPTNWDPPPPLPQASVPPESRLRVRGWGSPNLDDWGKSLSLCLLCVHA